MTASRPRVLLAEDHPSTTLLLQELLATEFEVIAAVENGKELVSACEALAPDVIVTDIAMPVMDGFTATSEILLRDPAARVVFVTGHRDAVLAERGLAVGGLGFVPKVTAGDELVPAVWAAFRRERWCLCNS
jgi:DNA-binding NarL/FixJ family response regulator